MVATTTSRPRLKSETYRTDWIGKCQRAKKEAELFKVGYKIIEEEEVKEWDAGSACCLAIVFLPLIFLAKIKKVRVTYELSEFITT